MEELTPKEKAIQLVNSFMDISEEQDRTLIKYLEKLSSNSYNNPRYLSKDIAKQCALIAVDETIKVASDESNFDGTLTKLYWQQVKQEIEKI